MRAWEPSQAPWASWVRPQPQALRVGAGAGAAWEPSQRPWGFFVLPQPQRLPPAGEGEGTLDIVPEGERVPRAAQAWNRGGAAAEAREAGGQALDSGSGIACWPGVSAQADGMHVEVEREEDGRWLAEVPAMPGALAYGASKEEAIARVEALVRRIFADKLAHGERAPGLERGFTVAE